MKHGLFFALLLVSCGKSNVNESDNRALNDSLATSDVVIDSTNSEVVIDSTDSSDSIDTLQQEIKVTAFLVYEDGELSSFDILNDDNVTLWNTAIGEGSAGRSSTESRVIIYGNEKEMDIVIKQNGEVSIEKKDIEIAGELEITVPETGCSSVEIILSRTNETLYQGYINFECGE